MANINLGVIKESIASLKQACHSKTEILLSGFLPCDEDELKPRFSSNGFQPKVIN
jgi:hypothetical protein